jgi:acetyl esterase/lipase
VGTGRANPKEKHNLADRHKEIRARLMAKLDDWWKPEVSPRLAPTTPVTKSLTFKEVGEAKLEMKLCYPPGWQTDGKKLPAIVFFFGGGWHGGDISQFSAIAPYLAHRGIQPRFQRGG